MPPPHVAVKEPAIAVADWLVIWNWKLVQVPGSGTLVGAAPLPDDHTPIIEGALGAVDEFVVGAVGAITLVECSKPHAAVIAAATIAAEMLDTLVITNLWWCAQSCTPGKPKRPIFRMKLRTALTVVRMFGQRVARVLYRPMRGDVTACSNTDQLQIRTG